MKYVEKRTSLKYLRWIGVIPASLLSSALLISIWYLLFSIGPLIFGIFGIDSGGIFFIFRLICGGMSIYFGILAGIFIAPNSKKIVGLLLVVIWICVIGSVFYSNLIQEKYFGIFEAIGGIGGALYVGVLILFTADIEEKPILVD